MVFCFRYLLNFNKSRKNTNENVFNEKWKMLYITIHFIKYVILPKLIQNNCCLPLIETKQLVFLTKVSQNCRSRAQEIWH